MEGAHKNKIIVNGTSYIDGGFPGLRFNENKEFVPLNGSDVQQLHPLETNSTKYLKEEIDKGSWAYPGTDEYVILLKKCRLSKIF